MIGMMTAAALAVSSQVTDVTVYNDRAQVVRTATVELSEGVNLVRFEDLPAAIDSRAIQVNGSGEAVILDVRFKVENLTEVPKEEWKALQALEEQLGQEEEKIYKRIEAYRNAKDFLSKISTKVTSVNAEEGAPELDPETWKKMLDMHLARQLGYDAEIRKAEKELKVLEKKKSKVEADRRSTGANMTRQLRMVEVDVEAAQAGAVELKLSYLVRGPQWIPNYDVRVNTEERKIELKYYAMVRQNTGEDWSDVAVKLSTANPGQGGQHPELQPWRIKEAVIQQLEGHRYPQDYNVETGQRTAPVVRPQDWSARASQTHIEARFVEFNEGALAELGFDWSLRGSRAGAQGTAVVFEIDGRSKIDSDNAEHRVAIGTSLLPAHFRYSTVPKMNAAAFLKARTFNNGDYPFLEGKANVYLDGSYVTASSLEFVPPGEEFWVFLGVDQGIKVEHKLIKRYESSEGLGGRKKRYTFEYLLTVKNAHDKEEEFIIWDHLPISGNEDVKVKLLEPRFSKNTDALTLDEFNRLQWLRTLAPGEELKIPFSFYIEMPKEVQVEGIN